MGNFNPKKPLLLGRTWDLEIPLLGIKMGSFNPNTGIKLAQKYPFLGKTRA